jgi:S1-C subfamily serine protease
VHTDPFQEATPDAEFDPAPGLTLVIERLAKEATKQVLAWAVDRQGPAPVVAVAESPALTAGFPDREVSAFDALTAEIWLQNRAKYLTPTLNDAEAGKVAKARPGLVVLRAPETAGVQVGDLITQVDGVPASTTVLARKRLALTPVQVRVRRGSQELDTTIP